MKLFRNVLTVLVVAVLAFAMVSCSTTTTLVKDVNTADGQRQGKTVILHSNDVHGSVEGYAKMAAAKAMYEAQGATVVTVDAGDFTQGTLYVSLSKGENAVTLMNAVGYDVVGLGNHEFDYGFDQLVENLKAADFEVICADVYKDGKLVWAPTAIVKVGSLKIGFYGLETPETSTKVNPGLIKGVEFASADTTVAHNYDLYEVAQKAIDSLSKCDIVIGLTHLGVDEESVVKGCGSTNLWANTTGSDFLIDAHSHTVMTCGPAYEPIQSTGTAFSYIGVIVIDNASKEIESNFLLDTASINADASVLALAKSLEKEVDDAYNMVFAQSLVNLNGAKAPGNRTEETNMGNLIADSMLWSVLSAGSLDVADDHVVAITNGGGIRAAINAGDVSKANINTVLPFGNTIAVDYVTGSQLLEALEASTYCTPSAIGGFPQVSGLVFTIDTTKAYDQGALYPDSTYYGPKSIKRVTINSVNGKPFSLTDTYAVITNNFVAAGGDTYYVFKAAYDAGTGFDTAIPMDLALMDYVSEVLGGTIGTQYAAPEGRIIVK